MQPRHLDDWTGNHANNFTEIHAKLDSRFNTSNPTSFETCLFRRFVERVACAASPPYQPLLETIRRDGIAITHVDDLGWQPTFEKLQDAVSAVLAGPRQMSQQKPYLYSLLEPNGPQRDPDDVFLQFALQQLPLQLASNYLRCFARLYGNELWLNIPVAAEPSDAQFWHRDPGDTRLLKTFIAFTDLTVETGAFYYVPGSHEFGHRSNLTPEQFFDGKAHRTNDEQMRRVVSQDQWRVCTGRVGTVIFADTRGYP